MGSSVPADAVTPAEARARAVGVRVDDHRLWVDTADGRTIGVPLTHLPWLVRATPEQRAGGRIYGGGYVLLWDELDETISVLQLAGLPPWSARTV